MLYIHLQLFTDGGGEAGGEGGNAAGGLDFDAEFQRHFGFQPGVAAPDQAEKDDKNTEAPTGEEVNAESEGQDAAAEEPRDFDKEFEGLVKGEYKDAFGKRVQGIINDRFKANNQKLAAAEEKLRAYQDAIDPYLDKLGVDKNDLEAIKNAAMEDRSNFRSRAVKNNQTVEEAMKAYQEARNEAKAQAAAEEQQQAAQAQAAQQAEQERQKQIFDGWKAEEAEIKKTDSDFDLAHEIAGNDEFRKALEAGLPVTFAYKATRFDDRMAQVAGAVEKQTALNTARQIAANRARPPEGGMNKSPAVKQGKVDYKNLPDEQILKILNST